jgi:hypothetical protein
MGPVVAPDLTRWTLRPFQTSATFHNLRRYGIGVFHVIDDVLPLARCGLGLDHELEFEKIDKGWVLPSACHWFQLRVVAWNIDQPRSEAEAEVIEQRVLRPFWGWNRAKHAIIEATILMTRRHLLDSNFIHNEFSRLQTAVEKTAGPNEEKAWRLLLESLKKDL